MVSESKYEDLWERTGNYVTEVNANVVRDEELEIDLEDIERGRVLEIEYSESTVHIYGMYPRSYFLVRYQHNFAQKIGRQLSEGQAEALSDELGDRPRQGQAMRAGISLLEQIDEDSMDDLWFRLQQEITGEKVGWVIWRTEEDAVYGFDVNVRLFPYVKGYSIKEVGEKVQMIISKGVAGTNYLEHVFDLNAEDDDSLQQSSSVELEGPDWMH